MFEILGLHKEFCFDEWNQVEPPEYEGNTKERVYPFGSTALCSANTSANTSESSNVSQAVSFSCPYSPTKFSSELKGSSLFTDGIGTSTSYGNEGFQVRLPTNRDAAYFTLAQLQRDFVDRATRALAFDVSMYNVDDDLLVVMQVSFYLSVTGQIEPYYRVQALKPMRQFMYCEEGTAKVVLVFYIVWQFILFFREIQQIMDTSPITYIADFWNVFEILYFVIVASSFYFAWRYQEKSEVEESFLKEDTQPTLGLAEIGCPYGNSRNITVEHSDPLDFMEIRDRFRMLKLCFG
eukprot:SAG31_NODE_2041_length_6590_cov_2.334155_1_plen_292_part_10